MKTALDQLVEWHMDGVQKFKYRGLFAWWEPGPGGKKLDYQEFSNGLCTVGINYALEGVFRGSAVSTLWYIGIIDATGYTGVAVTDTMGSHAGWAEFTSYTGSNRPAWGPAAAAGGIIANTTNFTFAISADGNSKGAFVTNTAAKSPGNTGIMWSTALQDRAVSNGTTLNGTYSFTLTPSS